MHSGGACTEGIYMCTHVVRCISNNKRIINMYMYTLSVPSQVLLLELYDTRSLV